MNSDAWKIGDLVVHPIKPEWGPGKIVKVLPERVYVVWRDLPDREAKQLITSAVRLAADQHDAVLDNLPPLVEKDGKLVLPTERITFLQAVEKFHATFPQGFEDPDYIGDLKRGERYYKWAAHEHYVERLGGDKFRELLENDLTGLVQEVERCISKVNIVFRTYVTPYATTMQHARCFQNWQTCWKRTRLPSNHLPRMRTQSAACPPSGVE